jgi:hypothetical protein
MDASRRLYYLDLQRRLRVLLGARRQPPAQDIDFVSEFVEANEQGIALEVLSNLVVERRVALRSSTFEEIEALVRTMGLEREVVEQLWGLVEPES